MKKLEEILEGMEKEDMKVIKDELSKVTELEGKFADLEKAKGEVDDKLVELEKVKPIKDETDEELIKSADPKIQKIARGMRSAAPAA